MMARASLHVKKRTASGAKEKIQAILPENQ
jgi:hypothetical protein